MHTFGKSNGHFKPHTYFALHHHTNAICFKFKRQRGKPCFLWIGLSAEENTFMQFRFFILSPKYAHFTEYVCNVPPIYTVWSQVTVSVSSQRVKSRHKRIKNMLSHSPHKSRESSKNKRLRYRKCYWQNPSSHVLEVAELTTNAERGSRRIQHFSEYLCTNSSDNILSTIQNSYQLLVMCARVHISQRKWQPFCV